MISPKILRRPPRSQTRVNSCQFRSSASDHRKTAFCGLTSKFPVAYLVAILYEYCLTIRPVALSGYGSIAHEVKPNGLLARGP